MTTSEVDTIDEGRGIELLPAAQAPSAVARSMLREHAAMMAEAYQLAKGICGDGRNGTGLMVPQRFRGKPEEAAAAMIYGAELGLNPLQAVQRVVPIHGMPVLESRTMVGLLKARGYKIRTVEQSDTSVTVEGVAPDGETASSTWTIQRATQAGYVPQPSSPNSLKRPDVESDWVTSTKKFNDGNSKTSVVGNMKYILDPQAMLKAKAQAEVCREIAPDVLMGISYTREDIESEDQSQFEQRSAAVRVQPDTAAPVTVDEIFAEEVPLRDERTDMERYAEQNLTGADAVAYLTGQRPAGEDEPPNGYVAPETPAGDEDQEAADPPATPEDPSPAEQPPAATSISEPKPEPEQVAKPATDAAAKAASKRVAAKRSTAPSANPDKPRTKMREALEKRLFTLLGDAGLSGEKDRDGRLAVYRSVLDRPDITSTNDLDDAAVGKVADQLYVWSQTAGELDDQIGGILADAAREAEETAAAAADPTTEGSE